MNGNGIGIENRDGDGDEKMMAGDAGDDNVFGQYHPSRQHILAEVDLRSFSDSLNIWKEFVISSSSSTSTVYTTHHNYQLPCRSGGYSYINQASPSTKNRIILWRILNNQLEIIEKHMNHNLDDNCIRINFLTNLVGDATILEFNQQYLVIVVITAAKLLYRFLLPHPAVIEQNDRVGSKRKGDPINRKFKSIFSGLQVIELDNAWSRVKVLQDSVDVTTIRCVAPNQVAIGSANSGTWWVELSEPRQSGELTSKRFELKESGNRFLSFLNTNKYSSQEEVADLSIIQLDHTNKPLVFILQRDLSLRIWSPVDRNLLESFSIHSETWDQITMNQIQGVKRFKLYKQQPQHYTLVLYIELEHESNFQFFSLVIDESSISLQLQRTTYIKSKGLVDFSLYNNYLYSLWSTKDDSQPALRYININNPEADNLNMEYSLFEDGLMLPKIIKERAPSAETIEQHYLERVFNHGQFTNKSIQSALSIYKPGYQVNPQQPLESQVANVIRERISNHSATNKKVPIELLSFNEWSEFYSISIAQVALDLQAAGLYIDPNTNSIFIIKRNKLSIMKALPDKEIIYSYNPIEHHKLNINSVINRSMTSYPHLSNDIIHLYKCFNLIDKSVGYDYSSLEHDLLRMKVNAALLSEVQNLIAATVVGDADDVSADSAQISSSVPAAGLFTISFIKLFKYIVDPVKVIDALLQLIESDLQINDQPAYAYSQSPQQNQWGGNLFVDILTSSFVNSVKMRYRVVRSLAMLVSSLSRLRCQVGITSATLKEFDNRITPRCYRLLKIYHILNWFTNQIYYPSQSSSSLSSSSSSSSDVEIGKMHLTESTTHLLKTSMIYTLISNYSTQFTSIYNHNFTNNLNIQNDRLLQLLSQIYPVANYLTEQSQYKQLSVLLTTINENDFYNNVRGYYYLMGLCFAHFSKYKEAYEIFVKASEALVAGVTADDDLLRIVMIPDEELVPPTFYEKSLMTAVGHNRQSSDRLIARFLLKCSKIFELRNQLEYVIQLSLLSIKFFSDSTDQNQETLSKISSIYANVFKYSLKISQYEFAYIATVKNPDSGGSMDCLHRLLIHLCENNQIAQLVSLPLVGTYQQAEEILLAKAKSQDLTMKPDYYSILYTLKMTRSDYRGAAMIIYEKAQRILMESHPSVRKGNFDVENLYKLKLDYLSLAINALSLVPELGNRWIPIDISSFAEGKKSKRKLSSPLDKPSESPAHDRQFSQNVLEMSLSSSSADNVISSGMLDWQTEHDSHVQIVWKSDLESEYIYYQSCYILRRFDTAISDHLSPKQLLAELLKYGLMEQAFSLAIANNMDLGSVFQVFAIKCIEFQLNPEVNPFSNQGSLESSAIQFYNDNVLIAWKLLENYLEKYDTNEDTECLTPSQVNNAFASKKTPTLCKMYGIIAKDSVRSTADGGSEFHITSDTNQFYLNVQYHRRMPKFYQEGYPVVVVGSMVADGSKFKAEKVLCKRGQSRYHELVVDTLLSFSNSNTERVDIPNWLKQWFKHGREETLFKLYFQYGRIEEAIHTLLDLLMSAEKTVLAQQQKQNSQKININLPYNTINQFLMELEKLLSSGALEDKAKPKLSTYIQTIKKSLNNYIEQLNKL